MFAIFQFLCHSLQNVPRNSFCFVLDQRNELKVALFDEKTKANFRSNEIKEKQIRK